MNENKIIDQLHKFEILIWFAKFKMLHLEKLQQISANNLLFIHSILKVNNELEYLQHLIEIVLVKNPSEKK